MKKTVAILVLLMTLFEAEAVSKALFYQVKLNLKEKLVPSSVTLRFELFQTQNSEVPLWGRQVTLVPDSNQVVSVEISDALPRVDGDPSESYENIIAQTGDTPLYLQVKRMDTLKVIGPRQAILSVPLAQNVDHATSAAENFTVSGTATINGAMLQSLFVEGNATLKTLESDQTAVIQGDVRLANMLTTEGDLVVKGKVSINSGRLSGHGVVPVGAIIAWSSPSLPTDGSWAICDGNNGTPDLRHRFIVGVNQDDPEYVFRKTGGADEVPLCIENIPSHNHTFSYQIAAITSYHFDLVTLKTGDDKAWRKTKSATAMTDNVGSGTAPMHPNLPPYCSLYFIMRTK